MKYEPKKKVGKLLVADTVLGVLKRGIKVCYRHDSRVRDILSKFEDGYVLSLRILPEKPAIYIKKVGDRILNAKKTESPNLEICFKNIDVAMPVLLGKRSIPDTYRHSSILTYGSVGDTVDIVECLGIVESYLFPRIITSRIMNTEYAREVSSFRIYLGVLLGV